MAMDAIVGCDISQCILLFLEQYLKPLICQTLLLYSQPCNHPIPFTPIDIHRFFSFNLSCWLQSNLFRVPFATPFPTCIENKITIIQTPFEPWGSNMHNAMWVCEFMNIEFVNKFLRLELKHLTQKKICLMIVQWKC